MHFQIHNGARDVQTRNTRAQNPTHKGLKQHIMNGSRRLVRGRPIVVTEEQLKQHLSELQQKAKDGILYVTTMDGKRVNIHHPKLVAEVAAAASNPRPNKPLDSADNDKPTGVPMNSLKGEAPPPAEFTMPVEPPVAAIENNPLVPAPLPPDGADAQGNPTWQGEPHPPPAPSTTSSESEQPPPELTDMPAPDPVTAEVPAVEPQPETKPEEKATEPEAAVEEKAETSESVKGDSKSKNKGGKNKG